VKRFERLLYSIVIVLSSGFIGFLVLEMVVRSLHLAPPLLREYGFEEKDPYLPYSPRPLAVSTGRSATDEYDFEYRHNSIGFRDVEHSFRKDEGVFRILGLGDSFTYGAGARFEETYLYRLEEALNRRPGGHPRVEVIKAGIGRFFPEPERMLLESYGRMYSPDLILIGFLPNDVIGTYRGLDACVVHKSGCLITREANELGDLGVLLYRKSHVCRMLLRRYVLYQMNRRYPVHWPDVYEANGFHEKDWQALEREYSKMSSIANELGANFVVVHIPQKGPWSDKHHYPARRLAAWAEENGAGFVDVLPAMIRAGDEKPLYYPKDGHCTQEGYAIIADEIYKYLVREGWVP
jgi:lysophospholipase L1-like esterase